MRNPRAEWRRLRKHEIGSAFRGDPTPRWVEQLEPRWLLADVGQPDPTFGDNGVVLTGFQNANPDGAAIAVTVEGKPIIAANQEQADIDFTKGLNLARFSTDGLLDTSFGTQGKVSLAIDRFLIGDAALQSDGKLLVAGTVADPNYPASPTDVLRFIVLRFNTDGSLDTSFGANGSVRTAFTSIGPAFSAEAKHIVVSPTGTIAVGGHTSRYVEEGDHVGMGIAVYNSSGQLLTSFSDDGIVTELVTAPDDVQLYGLGFQPDGKLLVSYHTFVPASSSTATLMRYSVDGTPDSSFGSNGMVQSVLGNPELLLASQILVAPDNKILLGAGNQLSVQRLNADGSPDTTFGGGDSIAEPANGAGISWGMLRLSDGRIRVSGPTWVQYNSDGTVNPTFTGTSKIPSGMVVDQEAAFDPAGKLITSGRAPAGDENSAQYSVIRFGLDDVALGNDGTLWVAGTDGDDTITISPLNDSARLVRNGVTTDFTGPVTSIQLDLGSGNNVAGVSMSVPVTVRGGSGNDSIATGDADDYIEGRGGSDTVNSNGGNDVIRTGGGDEYIDAGPGDDQVYAFYGDNTLIGGDGDDWLEGINGHNSIIGGAGNDHILCGNASSIAFGGIGDDYIRAGAGNDTIHGEAGADQIYAGDGNNLIFGGDGNDYIQSGAGNDTLWGEIGYDTVKAGLGDDYINGGAGKDRLFGQQGNDTIYAGRNDDALDGGPGMDLLKGGDGNDKLWDQDGFADRLFGGLGDDIAHVDDELDVLFDIETLLS